MSNMGFHEKERHNLYERLGVWLSNSKFGKTTSLLVQVVCHKPGELFVWNSLLWVAKMIYYNYFLWDRALDKLAFSFSSIPLDFCSINYLKLKTHVQVTIT